MIQERADYIASIRASYAISAMSELWYAMTQLSARYAEQETYQIAADILAFILLQNDVPQDIYDEADELFDALERRICPRVIWDAKDFAKDMDLEGMVDYILDV